MAEACEVWFYHLERTGLDQALPELLEKTLARGWKAIVRATGPQRVEQHGSECKYGQCVLALHTCNRSWR